MINNLKGDIMSKPPRNHIVSQFYYRNFTSTPDKPKNEQRVYTLDHNGVIENIEKSGRKIGSICHEIGYNTEQQENDFRQLERLAAGSIRRIIEGSLHNTDLEDVRGYVGYLIANQPHTRQVFVDKVVESTNALEIKDGIYGKGALTLMLTKLITDELITWESYIYRVQEVGANEYKNLFITSDNPVDTNRIDAIKVGQMPMYGDVENARMEDGKKVVKYYWDLPELSIEEDTYYLLPLNPITGFYVYRTPSQRSDLMQDEHVVEKTNLNQFRGATKFAIGHDCKLLKKTHKSHLINK